MLELHKILTRAIRFRKIIYKLLSFVYALYSLTGSFLSFVKGINAILLDSVLRYILL